MKSIGLFEAKTRLSEFVDRVEKGEEFQITRHGHAVAKLVPIKDPGTADRLQALDSLIRFGQGRKYL